MSTNRVPSDLKNVYVWDTARKLLPYLSNKFMMEGKIGRKQSPVSLGDAASLAIIEAASVRGIFLTPGKVGFDVVEQVPVVKVVGKVAKPVESVK